VNRIHVDSGISYVKQIYLHSVFMGFKATVLLLSLSLPTV